MSRSRHWWHRRHLRQAQLPARNASGLREARISDRTYPGAAGQCRADPRAPLDRWRRAGGREDRRRSNLPPRARQPSGLRTALGADRGRCGQGRREAPWTAARRGVPLLKSTAAKVEAGTGHYKKLWTDGATALTRPEFASDFNEAIPDWCAISMD